MQLPTFSSPASKAAVLSFFLFTPSIVSAVTFDCDHVRVDGTSYDFKSLDGPHRVTVLDEDHPPAIKNTTWTVDLCKPLRQEKDVPLEDQCPKGTRVCGVSVSGNAFDKTTEVSEVIPVAGTYVHDGRHIDPKYQRIKAPKESNAGQAGGLEVELHGGKWGKREQMVVINFQCDKTRTGNEGNEKAADEPGGEEESAEEKKLRRRADDSKGTEGDEVKQDKNSLRFVSYGKGENKDVDVLRLDWLTKQVCLDAETEDGVSTGWGFFTWFIIIAFLGTASYLVFGSWLNYSRYGARGWDLLPHGDTIRDIPYLCRDWTRKVVDTIQGGGSRGGYSAV